MFHICHALCHASCWYTPLQRSWLCHLSNNFVGVERQLWGAATASEQCQDLSLSSLVLLQPHDHLNGPPVNSVLFVSVLVDSESQTACCILDMVP